MKKRLLVMLLLLCLLLTALTATVAAAEDNYTGEQGMLTLNIKGQKRSFFITALYDCENDHGNTDLFNNRDADKLLSVQAKKPNGMVVPIAEWKPGDTILASIYISSFNCARPEGSDCGTMNKTIETTLEFKADDFCHLTRTSTTALTATMEHIRGNDVNDKITFKFYCYLYSLYKLEYNKAGAPTCEKDGYAAADWYRCPCCGKCFLNSNGTNEITVKKKLGHDFDANGVCQRCSRQAEAYIYNPTTQSKSYRATATEAIADASTGEAVIVVSYAAGKTDPIILNKIVDLTVNNGVTVPEIRLDTLSGTNTGASMNINNYGTVNLFSSVTAAQQSYPRIFIYNHSGIGKITVSNAQDIQIFNDANQTISEINIPQTDITSQQVQISNSGPARSIRCPAAPEVSSCVPAQEAMGRSQARAARLTSFWTPTAISISQMTGRNGSTATPGAPFPT